MIDAGIWFPEERYVITHADMVEAEARDIRAVERAMQHPPKAVEWNTTWNGPLGPGTILRVRARPCITSVERAQS